MPITPLHNRFNNACKAYKNLAGKIYVAPGKFFDSISRLFNLVEQYQIEGDSMLPELASGDSVLVLETDNLQIGDIVVANHPFRYTPIVKRISGINDDRFFLRGDNPEESTDSRSLGEFHRKEILGKVICKVVG